MVRQSTPTVAELQNDKKTTVFHLSSLISRLWTIASLLSQMLISVMPKRAWSRLSIYAFVAYPLPHFNRLTIISEATSVRKFSTAYAIIGPLNSYSFTKVYVPPARTNCEQISSVRNFFVSRREISTSPRAQPPTRKKSPNSCNIM